MHRPVGDTITTVYDMASRVLSRDYRLKAISPSGTIADQDTFTYDSSSRMLTGVSGRYSNTVTNTFDNAGRLSTESLTIGGQTYTVTSEYDLRSQRKKVTYPNSSTWERTYTARRQLYETKYNGSTVDTRVYDDGGRLDTSTYANGVVADYNWRADNLLADIGFSHPVGVAANRRIGTYTYAWDANKNKTKETITGQIPGYSFDTTLGTDPDGYDDEDRLTYFKRQSTGSPQTWNLSLVGDWNSWSNFGTTQSRTHGPAHEILTAGNTPNNAFSHDVKGNMTDIPSNILSPSRKLFWDFDNQLTGVDTTGDSTPEVTYEYDVLHRRVARIEGSNSKVYIHSGNQVIADYNRGTAPGTAPVFRYVWGDYIDEPILRQTGSTTILYYHRNQQYSIIALTNTSGEVVEHYGYTAYGQLTVMNYLGNVRSWSDWSNRFLYTGREWDDTTKLFHFRARWYEPVAGRFVSRDPIGYVQVSNLYLSSIVLTGNDFSGLYAWKEAVKDYCVFHCVDEYIGLTADCLFSCYWDPSYNRQEKFDFWVAKEKEAGAWWTKLDPCPKFLEKECRYSWISGYYSDWKNPNPGKWYAPKQLISPTTKYHPPARYPSQDLFGRPIVVEDIYYELRSIPSEEGYGNQCIYNCFGNLVTTPMLHGTVDMKSPKASLLPMAHWQHDVQPIVQASILDGCWRGGVYPWGLFGAMVPNCIGPNMQKYLEVRPMH